MTLAVGELVLGVLRSGRLNLRLCGRIVALQCLNCDFCAAMSRLAMAPGSTPLSSSIAEPLVNRYAVRSGVSMRQRHVTVSLRTTHHSFGTRLSPNSGGGGAFIPPIRIA